VLNVLTSFDLLNSLFVGVTIDAKDHIHVHERLSKQLQ